MEIEHKLYLTLNRHHGFHNMPEPPAVWLCSRPHAGQLSQLCAAFWLGHRCWGLWLQQEHVQQCAVTGQTDWQADWQAEMPADLQAERLAEPAAAVLQPAQQGLLGNQAFIFSKLVKQEDAEVQCFARV